MRQRSRHLFAVACLAAAVLAGCSGSESDIPARYGLSETPRGRSIAEQAVLLANLMLPPTKPIRFDITWAPAGWWPIEQFVDPMADHFSVNYMTDGAFDQRVVFAGGERIPVYLIDGSQLGALENSFVPEGQRCVFVNAAGLDQIFEAFSLSGDQALEVHNSYDKALVLALMLLHELGHLTFHDASSYGPPAALDVAALKLRSTDIANAEMRADRFASELVDEAFQTNEWVSPFPGPYARSAIASNIFRVIAIGSNTPDFRNDPQGLLDHVTEPQLFHQKGYSHLNLYVRLLVLLQELEPSDERLGELRWIESLFTAS